MVLSASACSAYLFAQRIDFFRSQLFQLVQPLAHFAFALGCHVSEIVEELRYFTLFAQVFDAKIFHLFGFGGREGFDFFSQSVYLFYHVS